MCWEKVATFNLFFLGLGLPWVGECVGFTLTFTITFVCFPTQQNLVNRKDPYATLFYYCSWRHSWLTNFGVIRLNQLVLCATSGVNSEYQYIVPGAGIK